MIVIYIMAFSNDERYSKIKKNWSIRIQVSKLNFGKRFNDYLREGEYIKVINNFFGNGWDFYKNYSLSL